jgi:cyclopropane-fatty-acyl-phospholipid synthase
VLVNLPLSEHQFRQNMAPMWLLLKFLARTIRLGRLMLIEANGRVHEFGTAHPDYPDVTLRFADGRVPGDIMRNPRLGFGEAWLDGRLIFEVGDIERFLTLFRKNASWESGGEWLKPKGLVRRLAGDVLARLDRLNWERKSKRNVAHHYDLDDRLFSLFLDHDRQYSCAYFTDTANDLDTAQADKKAHIAAKLALSPGQRVLDIGCGWGGMALYLNRLADVEVLGITLSEEQLKVARARAEEAGVADRVRFELIDYRAVEGQFDRIVSVGMFEHVGPRNYHRFFAMAKTLLSEDGVMLLHTIGRMGKPGTTDPFTAKYIFPGGYNPALSEIVAASERARLILTDVEVLRLHYAHTLDIWLARTNAARDKIVEMYDERFFRLWQFYLAGASGAFRYGGLVNFQLQYARHRHALPITRDYMATTEVEYQAKAARLPGRGMTSRASLTSEPFIIG